MIVGRSGLRSGREIEVEVEVDSQIRIRDRRRNSQTVISRLVAVP